MPTRIGFQAALYYKEETAVNEFGSWFLLPDVREVTLNLEHGEADISTRWGQGWRATTGALKDATVEWEQLWRTTDAGFLAIRNAWLKEHGEVGRKIRLCILDGQPSTSNICEGLHGDFEIMTFDRNEPLEDALTVSVTARLAEAYEPGVYPVWESGLTGLP